MQAPAPKPQQPATPPRPAQQPPAPPAAAQQVQGQPARRPLPPKLSERQLKAEPQPAHAVADLALARTRACGDDLKDLKYASAA